MNPSALPDDCVGFDSRNTEILEATGPGDTTIRPMTPEEVRRVLAERDRLERLRKETPPPGPTECAG
jgi:hypothetical protein